MNAKRIRKNNKIYFVNVIKIFLQEKNLSKNKRE